MSKKVFNFEDSLHNYYYHAKVLIQPNIFLPSRVSFALEYLRSDTIPRRVVRLIILIRRRPPRIVRINTQKHKSRIQRRDGTGPTRIFLESLSSRWCWLPCCDRKLGLQVHRGGNPCACNRPRGALVNLPRSGRFTVRIAERKRVEIGLPQAVEGRRETCHSPHYGCAAVFFSGKPAHQLAVRCISAVDEYGVVRAGHEVAKIETRGSDDGQG